MGSTTKLGGPWPLAYGHVRAAGFQAALHQLGDSSLVGMNLLGEGPWSGRLATWINGVCFGTNYNSPLPDDNRFHFHPGIDAPLGSTLTPASAGGDQLVDSFWGLTGAIDELEWTWVSGLPPGSAYNPLGGWGGYSSSVLYVPGMIVVYEDPSGHIDQWICIAPIIGVAPAVGVYWQKLSTLTAAELAANTQYGVGAISTDVSLSSLSSPTTYSRIAYLAFHCYPSAASGNADIMGDYETMMCEIYDGAGNFQALKFTTNPVWHFLDVLLRRIVRPNYVIGQPLTAQQKACIGWEEFYNAAAYCDEVLAGGQPRFVGNYYFNGNAATTAILERILLACRGYSRTVGGTVTIYCDQPRATTFYLTSNHIVPNSFKFDKSKIWQSGNRIKATFNDLNIPGIAPLSTVQVGTSTEDALTGITYPGTTLTFPNPHPYGPKDIIIVGGTDTPAVNGISGTVIYIPDTGHVVISYQGSAVTAHGGSSGLVVSRFAPRVSTEVHHASHQRAVAAQAPGALGARRQLDVPLDFGNCTYEQACRLAKFQRDRDLGPDGAPWIAAAQPSVTANFESVDAEGNCLTDVQCGDIISIDDTVSYEYPGLYELIEKTVHPPSFQSQGGNFALQGAVPSLPTVDASSNLTDLVLRTYNPAAYSDTADADDADWLPIPGVGLIGSSGNTLGYNVLSAAISTEGDYATITNVRIQIVGGPVLAYEDTSDIGFETDVLYAFFYVDDPDLTGGQAIGVTTTKVGAPAGRIWVATIYIPPGYGISGDSGGDSGGGGGGGDSGGGDSGSGDSGGGDSGGGDSGGGDGGGDAS
jgi:hypothetical protein